MFINQGFSMTLTPVDQSGEVFDLQIFSHFYIGDQVSTRDRLLGAMIAVDSQWARDIPADQFAYLALKIAQHFITAGQDAESIALFNGSIAHAMEAIINPSDES